MDVTRYFAIFLSSGRKSFFESIKPHEDCGCCKVPNRTFALTDFYKVLSDPLKNSSVTLSVEKTPLLLDLTMQSLLPKIPVSIIIWEERGGA